MSAVTQALRDLTEIRALEADIRAALAAVVAAHLAEDPTAPESIERLESALDRAEQLLIADALTHAAKTQIVDAGDGPAAASSTGDLSEAGGAGATAPGPAPKPKPASTKPTTTGGRRRQPSPGAAAGDEPGPLKWCNDCGEHRPRSEFGRNKSKADGLAVYCRTHQAARSAASARKKKSAQKPAADGGDKEGHPVPADVITLPIPRPPADLPPAKGERICTACGKSLPRSAFRRKPQGLSKQCFVCDGSQNMPLGGPDPLPGEISFSTTLTCSRCDLEQTTKHPPAMDRDAIAEALRRVEQALHDCPGQLAVAVEDAGRDRPDTPPVPRRGTGQDVVGGWLVSA